MPAALFDLDGVLVDTETIYTRIWEEIDSIYPSHIENFALKIKGNTLERILTTYYADDDTRRSVVSLLKEREEAMEYPVFEGVVEFLSDLRRCGVPAAIVTSSNLPKMTRLFGAHPGFRDFFGAVLTDKDVSNSKPHPEGYLKAAATLGADPAECIVFEDSYAGLEAGRSAGARVVALATTNPRHTLIDKADAVIDGFADLTLEALMRLLEAD